MKRSLFGTIVAAGASLVASTTTPQSFNVDLDNVIGGWGSPHGPPRNGFGGAAGQAGFWEAINAADPGPVPLRDVRGNATSVVFRAWGGVGSGGGWRNPRLDFGIVNDDFWLLMGDAARIGSPFAPHQIMPPPPLTIYTFDGLEPGLYDVYTYAVLPAPPPRYVPVQITVPGSTTENPQLCTGPMPLDWVFRRGVTHSVHRVRTPDGRIEVRTTGEFPYAHINGFQLVRIK